MLSLEVNEKEQAPLGQRTRAVGMCFYKREDLKKGNNYQLRRNRDNDVNKTDRPNTTPTVRAIWSFAVYFSRGVNRQIGRSVPFFDPPKFLFKSETTTTSENRSLKVQR